MDTLDALSLVADKAALTQALNWLETLGERQRWPTHTKFALTLCLDEALTNIVMHGKHPDNTPARLILRAQQDPTDVVLTITDDGPAFDPTRAQSPELALSVEQAGIGGHGMRLMRHYLKDIHYCRTDGFNQLTLTAPLDAS